jgi:beta-phosphoglucomutase-like phosphatase (HAD superfamily)
MPRTKKAPIAETPNEKSETPKKCAILLELENVTVGGRQIAFDVMKKIMADKGVKLTPFHFSRYCMTSSLKKGIGEMLEALGKGRLSEEKMASDVAEEIKSLLMKGSLTLAPGVKKLVKRAAEEGVAIGVLSCYDRETAQQLVKKLELDKGISAVFAQACEERSYPSTDSWLRLAKTMSMSPGVCVVIATCSMSSKAAVSSGMRCVVIPDKFTAFQDFGGADYVSDELDEAAIDKAFSLLEDR